MKKISSLLLLALIISCKSKQPSTSEINKNESVEVTTRFEKINLKEVNNQKLTRAYNLGKRLLETCNTSRFKVFSKEEATDKVIQNATVEKITKTCQKILMRNGKFIDLNLIDVTQDNETEDLFFRYKIEYEKKYFERELYITINSEGKVSEMKTKELPKKPM
ncbi:hypothetical protein [Flavobacterium sp.]|uniref:hypothetical protein n=1 Tax=Flavobacterium sp. TaxID=239 RepID=UPI002639B231|nr:hypothetical protein [Flavobacterium sp.]